MTIFEELRLVCILRFGLIKAVFNARPPKPKHTLTWDGDDPFSTYQKISEKLTFSPLIRTRTCAYQGIRNVGFSENFANVLN